MAERSGEERTVTMAHRNVSLLECSVLLEVRCLYDNTSSVTVFV